MSPKPPGSFSHSGCQGKRRADPHGGDTAKAGAALCRFCLLVGLFVSHLVEFRGMRRKATWIPVKSGTCQTSWQLWGRGGALDYLLLNLSGLWSSNLYEFGDFRFLTAFNILRCLGFSTFRRVRSFQDSAGQARGGRNTGMKGSMKEVGI